MIKQFSMRGVDSSWRLLSFRARLSTLVAATALGGAAIVGSFAIRAMETERLTSIENATRERAQATAMNARMRMLEHSEKRTPVVLSKDSIEDFKKWKIPRWPARGEMFVGEIEGTVSLIGGDLQGQIWRSPFNKAVAPWESFDKVAYWFTAQGVMIGASSKLVKKQDFAKRLLVQFYEQSTARLGGDFFRPAEGAVYAAFYEVPKSNVIVGVETATKGDGVHSGKIIAVSVCVSFLLLLLSLWIGGVAARSFIQPLNLMLATLERFNHGVFDYFPEYHRKDEIANIFAVVKELGQSFGQREKKLHSIRSGMERLLVGSREMTLVHDRYTVCSIAASVALSNVSLTEETNAWIYIRNSSAGVNKSSENSFWTAQIVARGHVQQGTLVLGPCQHSQNPDTLVQESVAHIEPATKLLILPFGHNEKTIGFLVFDGYTGEQISSDDQTFLDALGGSVGIAIHNIHVLEQAKESARLEGEFCAVRTVQESLISRNFKADGVEVFSEFMPAQTAGGDWFHFNYCESDEHLYIYIGDVTGHGIPSAMMTAVCFGAVRSAENLALSTKNAGVDALIKLKLIAQVTNSIIFESGREAFYMSMLFVAIHVPTGKFHVVNAGHPAPLWVKSSEKKTVPIPLGGDPLGCKPTGEFEDVTETLSPGDGLMLYTDGLVENEGPTQKRISKREIFKVLNQDIPREAVLDSLVKKGKEIWLEQPQNDDLTAILCWWVPTPKNSE
jgi:serine phosphatase RsbU (regulator of sigma subunit)